jgi:hypothetical protein
MTKQIEEQLTLARLRDAKNVIQITYDEKRYVTQKRQVTLHVPETLLLQAVAELKLNRKWVHSADYLLEYLENTKVFIPLDYEDWENDHEDEVELYYGSDTEYEIEDEESITSEGQMLLDLCYAEE